MDFGGRVCVVDRVSECVCERERERERERGWQRKTKTYKRLRLCWIAVRIALLYVC